MGRQRILEHHRVDPSAGLARTLALGLVLVTIGGLTAACSFVVPLGRDGRAVDGIVRGGEVRADGTRIERAIEPWQVAMTALGLSGILIGIGRTIFVLRAGLVEESYLALRDDGALFRRGDDQSFVRWDEIASVRWDAASRAIHFERHDGSVWARDERYDVDGETLAARAAEIRRKALFGLLS